MAVSGESRRRWVKSARLGALSALLVLALLPTVGGSASGEEKLSTLKARKDDLQAELNAAAAKVEEVYSKQQVLTGRLLTTSKEIEELRKKNAKLQEKVALRAAALYKAGSTGVFEILLSSEDIADLSNQAAILSRMSMGDTSTFVSLRRSEARLATLEASLRKDRKDLAEAEEILEEEMDKLQARFDAVAADYSDLVSKLAAQRSAAAPSAPSGAAPVAAASLSSTDGMYCPVGGPVSFTDTWGAPRSGGRSHQGVDMLAARGTPQVAIVSGTITYAGYSSLGGNVQYLSGDDGNLYIYVHQDRNIVTGGRVKAGQTISTVGDTGNAAGTPHLHFEYHPGGGAAVNPTPLVSSLC